MGAGIRIDYMDGTRIMELKSGLIAPSLIVAIPGNYNTNKMTYDLPGRIPGSKLLVIPQVSYVNYSGQYIACYNGYEDMGDRITIKMYDHYRNMEITRAICSILVLQYPVGDVGAGIKMENSTDFTKITTDMHCCKLLMKERITFYRRWKIPDINGISASRLIVAAQWNDPSVSVSRSDYVWNQVPTGGSYDQYITAYPPNRNRSPNDGREVTMDILIYGPGYPEQGNSGIRILNSNNNCVFSTKERPFVISGEIPKKEHEQDCDNMIVLDSPGYFSYMDGSFGVNQHAGYVMANKRIKTAYGAVGAEGYGNNIPPTKLLNNPTLLLPPLY